ncbi:hypothetical protein [Paenibacillus arenosi]|uniref:Uncharacterized protein n=1 Tax=Paenibacillus arenosi TaxID=2774142 RepID=A0ABR9B478_9BACL|nr:hypothetical protein [Paenibacillus arenosi]MBD8501072.1 hypothetical protein [Paenibacillus arenosi]
MGDLINLILLVLFTGYICYKNKHKITYLSPAQAFGIIVAFIGITTISGLVLYYGGQWLVSYIHMPILAFVVKIAIIIIVITLASLGLHAIILAFGKKHD